MQIVSIPGNSARYPDRISAAAPRELRFDLRRAAEMRRMGTSEFIRQAVTSEVEATLSAARDTEPQERRHPRGTEDR